MLFLLWGAVLKNASLKAMLTVVEKKEDIAEGDLKDYTQKHWIRKPHQERGDMEEKPQYEKYKSFIMYHLHRLGMIDAVMPKGTHYDYVIIHGAMMSTMQERINFLKKIQPSIHYKQIVFLSGKRMLDPVKEKASIEAGLKTEADGAKYLMNKNGFLNVTVIDAQEFKGARPNTQDTVDTWLKTKPLPGRILAISNNPYIQRQDLVLCHSIGKGFTLETVGPQAKRGTKFSVFFDELARLIYTEVQVAS